MLMYSYLPIINLTGYLPGCTLLTNVLNNTLASKSSLLSEFVAERDEFYEVRLQTIQGLDEEVSL